MLITPLRYYTKIGISKISVRRPGTSYSWKVSQALFIHYDVASWYHPQGAHIKIESIGVYDSFMEYEAARMKQLHASDKKDIPNIN